MPNGYCRSIRGIRQPWGKSGFDSPARCREGPGMGSPGENLVRELRQVHQDSQKWPGTTGRRTEGVRSRAWRQVAGCRVCRARPRPRARRDTIHTETGRSLACLAPFRQAQRQGYGRNPLMHGPRKSEPPVLPGKRPDKPGRPGAEAVEGRGGARRTAGRQSMGRTSSREIVSQALAAYKEQQSGTGMNGSCRNGRSAPRDGSAPPIAHAPSAQLRQFAARTPASAG